MLPELSSLCRQTVQLEAKTGTDGYGQASYAPAQVWRARVVGRRRLVVSDRGEQVVSTHTVYFAGNPPIGPHDRLTLSTGDVGSTETGAIQPVILSVAKSPDDLGRMSTAVYLA